MDSDNALFFGLPEADSPPAGSSSPPSGGSVGFFFNTTIESAATDATAATHSAAPDDIFLGCDLIPCSGGTLSLEGLFNACKKRPSNAKVKQHSRGMVCTIHHAFVKCQHCRAKVHVGCSVPHTTGYIQIHRDFIWTCQQCTLKVNQDCKTDVLSQCTLKSEVSVKTDPEGESKEQKTETKCIFASRQLLVQQARDQGWITRSSQKGAPRMYFVCQNSLKTQVNGKPGGCAVTFKAKAHSADKDLPDGVSIEDVEWCAVNMPIQHDCCKHVLRTALTSRVCHLPRDAYREIQRLACCKAFNSQSIQQYIKMTYSIVVDVSLIYNIGYRARMKIGIGDVGLLLAQQQVRVYTSTSLLRIFT